MAIHTITKPKNQNTVSRGSGADLRPSNSSTSRNTTAASKRRDQGASNQNTDHKTTKQERVLTLLSRAKGASIDEVMQATNWQQHSVRGFFAGTVKKKLGFNLTSTKREGHVRRYRIKTNRR